MANTFQEEREAPDFETVAELAENLVYRLPGCTDLMIRKAIQDVFREFCRETKCLTAERRIDLEPGRRDYPLFSMFGGAVEGVRSVAVGRQLLRPGIDYETHGTRPVVVFLAPCWLPPESPKSEEEAADGMTMPWTIAERSGTTPPDETRTMRVIQEEVPLIGSEKAPVGFVALHGEAICSGVLARLCSMTGRAWTDAQVAAQELVRYENAKSELRMRRETPPGGRVIDTSMVL